MTPHLPKSLALIVSAFFFFTTSCSMQKLKNTIDGVAFQCGSGYNPEQSYIKINDPAQSSSRTKIIVLADSEVPVTAKGCIERPQKRVYVTNLDRSAGIWVAPDSANSLTLEETGRTDLPAACNSVVHGDGAGFTLNFDLPSFGVARELQALSVILYHLKSWTVPLLIRTEYNNFCTYGVCNEDRLSEMDSQTQGGTDSTYYEG